MDTRFAFKITAQPTENTCGPTCLHSVYRYYGDPISLDEVIRDIPHLPDGSTLDASLGLHALSRGYRATLFVFNLSLFDPTWFALTPARLRQKLRAQLAVKQPPVGARHGRNAVGAPHGRDLLKLEPATEAYIEFLERGGRLKLEDPTPSLLRRHLRRGTPILTGLSSTWLYRAARELDDTTADDIRGAPAGHFVVLHGYDPKTREVAIADPYSHNPYRERLQYRVKMERLIAAMLLGVVTYDCNMLVIEPRRPTKRLAPFVKGGRAAGAGGFP